MSKKILENARYSVTHGEEKPHEPLCRAYFFWIPLYRWLTQLLASGCYLKHPVFANAVRTAKHLGYLLISYETSAYGPDNDPRLRDRTQATRVITRVCDHGSEAKMFIIAGRLHASEKAARDGWMPMGAK